MGDMTEEEWADVLRLDRLREQLDEIQSLEEVVALNENGLFTVQMGETGLLKERSNPSTGYTWIYDSSECEELGLMLMTEYFMDEPEGLEDGMIPDGMGGQEVFIFDSTSSDAGTCDIKFAYVRPWEFSWEEQSEMDEV